MRRLQRIVAFDEYCILVSKVEDTELDQWMLVLSNAVGCPLDSKIINIEPKYITMNKTHLILANDEVLYYWQYRTTKTSSIEASKKTKSGKENAFHIEELPKADGIYDVENWV